ncbi:heme biosynthesis HemY N-terminal domain-containing protein [Zophobihabitans entericus]|uniref:HemY N-terminal domain-containing protein n=1 Tax=Zophobihabitans entericus TaxID=1635327 RepID=A0A6G9IAK2_9GAMM|nr:heme biosynthesis HemY N-terminal domain-containing protein [Zophobihabitans entericus]QIQ21251.1 hypothetical protein IPMB12_05870 [Zophobihabitans entericus]
MLKTLIIFLILIAGLIVGPMIAGHQGIAFFQLAGYRIKMSFTTFLVLEAILFVVLYLIYWLIKKITGTSSLLGRWMRLVSPKRSTKRLEIANLMMLEGNYKKAQKLYTQGAKYSHNIAVTYLQAVRAALNNNDITSAYQLLEKAAPHCQDKERFAFQLTQIRIEVQNNEVTTARYHIEQLLDDHPRNNELLKMADKVYCQLQDYQAAIGLFPSMYKAATYTEQYLDQHKQAVYLARIQQLANNNDVNALYNWWKDQPRAVRNTVAYQKEMAVHLATQGKQDEAQKLLNQLAKNQKIAE